MSNTISAHMGLRAQSVLPMSFENPRCKSHLKCLYQKQIQIFGAYLKK